MNNPLWKDLRRLRENRHDLPLGQVVHQPQFRRSLACATIALAAFIGGSLYGDLQAPALHKKLIALAAAITFLLSCVFAVRSLATECGRAVGSRAGRTAGTTVQVGISATGFIFIFFITLDLLNVSVQHLLLGGAITGVILGIALQQSLANVFAGLVLMLAQPFTIGEHVRIRSGALGGEFYGTVVTITLAYVIIDTPDGVLNVPNAGVLSAAVGPYPPPKEADTPADTPAEATKTAGQSPGGEQEPTGGGVGGGVPPDQASIPFPTWPEVVASEADASAAEPNHTTASGHVPEPPHAPPTHTGPTHTAPTHTAPTHTTEPSGQDPHARQHHRRRPLLDP